MKNLIIFLLVLSPRCFAETWKIVTVDWPPYSNDKVSDEGAACRAFAEAMKTVGVDIEYVFLPWTRGINDVQKPDYVGIFPAWDGDKIKGLKTSPALFSSPIVFVDNKEKIHKWNKITDFKGLNIGIADSYGYPPEFLELGKKGFYTLSVVATDEQNLRMLSYRRIDLTIVDLFNGLYLAEVRFPELKSKLYFDPLVYRNAPLYLSLKNDAHFTERIVKIKKALKNLPMQARVDELLKKIFAHAPQIETKSSPTAF
jgi:polar amino acid transport system substrate-binding protein